MSDGVIGKWDYFSDQNEGRGSWSVYKSGGYEQWGGVTEIEGNVELKSRANFTDIVRKRESGSFRLQSLNSELPYMMTI